MPNVGLSEVSHWACLVLSQYYPKQLMVLLKAKARIALAMELCSQLQYRKCRSDQWL
jgi:hypothetical protein